VDSKFKSTFTFYPTVILGKTSGSSSFFPQFHSCYKRSLNVDLGTKRRVITDSTSLS